MFKSILMAMVMVVMVVCLQGCQTASGPAVIVPAGIDQPVYVPAGERVVIVSPYDGTTRLQSQKEAHRYSESIYRTSVGAQRDQLRYESDKNRNETYLQRTVVQEGSRNLQTFQNNRTKRMDGRQDTISDLAGDFFKSQPTKTYVAPKSAPRPTHTAPRTVRSSRPSVQRILPRR